MINICNSESIESERGITAKCRSPFLCAFMLHTIGGDLKLHNSS